MCSRKPKSEYHYEVCQFINKERNRLRKNCRFFEEGCTECRLTMEKTTENGLRAILSFCTFCSFRINVIKKTKYMLYFYTEEKPKVKDTKFVVECDSCKWNVEKDSEDNLKVVINFCKKCSKIFCTVIKGKCALYFY